MNDLVKAFGGLPIEFAVLLKKIENSTQCWLDVIEITEEVKELKLN